MPIFFYFDFQLGHSLILINELHRLFAQGVFTCEIMNIPYTCVGLVGKFDLCVCQICLGVC